MAVYAEQEIINGCLNKDRLYEEYLYKTYYSIFLAICMRYAKDIQQAKQLLNDGFVKIFLSIKDFRNEGPFEGWMRKIVVNTCLTYLRSSDFKKNNQTISLDDAGEAGNAVTYNEALKNIDAQELINMLQALPPATRTVFNLFAFEGYNHNEIAGILRISTGTSSWHVSNARSILRQRIIKKQAV